MKTSLRAKLEQAIQDWVEENCEGEDWPNIYVSENLSELMTNAAATVMDGMESHEQYLQREDLMA